MNNTSCILTVIKNEHEYLDEWIKYHLDLGVNHLFIYEDIDSDSHKEITDKYGDKVSLDVISNVLSTQENLEAANLKKRGGYNPQHMYFKGALQHLKETYPDVYDWCFIIDIDEFITLEKEGTKLTDILSLYEDYDAFVMQWKCYGANGLVNKPDYSVKGVVDTFTKEAEGKVPDMPCSFVKTCHNLRTYRREFFYNQHYPTNVGDWCNTEFKRKDNYHPVYTNIYIRHYITKSWEEYVWKRRVRGFPWGGQRTFEFFFILNPDMNDKKEELLMEINKEEVLVVLPYSQTGSQGRELQLALSAWRKFCTFNYHFVVIGEFGESLESLKEEFPWVEFITSKKMDKKPDQYNQHLDVIHCFEKVIKKYRTKYTGFIWMVDDNYAIKPFDLEDILTVHYQEPAIIGNKNAPATYFLHDKWKTRQLLDRENLPHVYYTTHFPCWFDFEKLLEIWANFKMYTQSYVLEDVYFNYFPHPEPVQVDSIKLDISSFSNLMRDFPLAVHNPHIKFINNSVNGWSKELEDRLEEIITGKKREPIKLIDRPEVPSELQNKEILVVLPYIQKEAQGKELQLALTSWKKFCTFDYHFVVVGDINESIKEQFPWVEFIECERLSRVEGQYTPHLDVQHKMEIVMKKYEDKYSGFVWTMDDTYAIKPFDLRDILLVCYHKSELRVAKNFPPSFYSGDEFKTRELLDRENLPHIDYCSHYPRWFEFDKLKEMWDKFDMRKESYVFEDVYFNYFPPKERVLDNDVRFWLQHRCLFSREFPSAIYNPNIKFVNNTVFGWDKEIEKELEEIINEFDSQNYL